MTTPDKSRIFVVERRENVTGAEYFSVLCFMPGRGGLVRDRTFRGMTSSSIEGARSFIPKGCRRGTLMEGDDPAVVEWWFCP